MKQKVALVLSGGGARGLAHIGVIAELEKRGYEITSVAGTSMGSLIGGVYALGKLEDFTAWARSMDRVKILRLFDFSLGTTGLVKGERVLKKMKSFIPDTDIESLELPYAAVAVDLLTSREVVFREGSIYDAIRASISIPSVFTPVKKDGQVLVDGGVMNNVPVDHVVRNEGDMLVAVNVNADIPLPANPGGMDADGQELGDEDSRQTDDPMQKENPRQTEEKANQEKWKEFYRQLGRQNRNAGQEKLGYFSLISRTIDLMTNHMSDLLLEKHSPDLLINVSREHCHVFDFFRVEDMIEAGRLAAAAALD